MPGLNFSWQSAGEGFVYDIYLVDPSGNMIWEKDNIGGTSLAYDGQPLTAGKNYMYRFQVRDSNTTSPQLKIPLATLPQQSAPSPSAAQL